MTTILYQYHEKQYTVSGSHGTYKITTNFIAKTQMSWVVAVQLRLHVVELQNDAENHSSVIIFTHSAKQEMALADILEELKLFLR